MPAIAVGRCNLDEVLREIRRAAERHGTVSRACIITPALLGVPVEDLRRLGGGAGNVRFDGSRLWVRGVDYAVRW